ncbi:hypothetical protein GCM10029964_007390 [Kibdelosporangium lantanae]
MVDEFGDGQPVQGGQPRRQHDFEFVFGERGEIRPWVAGVGHREIARLRPTVVADVVDHGQEQPFLVAEVVVDRLLADARLGGDGVHAAAPVPVGKEDRGRRVDDRGALGRRPPLGRAA